MHALHSVCVSAALLMHLIMNQDAAIETRSCGLHSWPPNLIVVDKCHLTVAATEYRPSIIELTAIRSLRTQFVYLMATLLPSMLAEFEERNYLYHPIVFRALSNRLNIFYMVCKIDARARSLLKQAVAKAKEAWTDSGFFDHAYDKIILYVPICKDTDDLAELLSCSSYTVESRTLVEKKQILDY
jgi:superfamily II DNA helicase RecQ